MIGIAGVADMDQSLCTGTTTLVVWNQGSCGKVLLFSDRLNKARDLICATAGSGHDNEINRLAWCPTIRQELYRCSGKN